MCVWWGWRGRGGGQFKIPLPVLPPSPSPLTSTTTSSTSSTTTTPTVPPALSHGLLRARFLSDSPPFSVYQIGFTYAAPAKHVGRNRLGGGGPARAAAGSDVPLAGDPQAKVVLHRIFDDGIDMLSDGGAAGAGRHSGRRSGRRRQTLPHRSLEEKARMINLNMVSIFRDDGMNIRLLQPVPGCFFQTLPNLAICVDPSPEANPALGSAAPLADSPSLHSILEEPLGDGFVVLGDSVACMDRPPDDTTVLLGVRAGAPAGAAAIQVLASAAATASDTASRAAAAFKQRTARGLES